MHEHAGRNRVWQYQQPPNKPLPNKPLPNKRSGEQVTFKFVIALQLYTFLISELDDSRDNHDG
jgi:hypothetical protein